MREIRKFDVRATNKHPELRPFKLLDMEDGTYCLWSNDGNDRIYLRKSDLFSLANEIGDLPAD